MTLEVAIDRRLSDFRLNVAIQAAAGELVVLFGHSGSGQSMTLRSIAGLDRPDAGRIALNGHVVFDASRGINLAPHLRNVGLVVQRYALFPHLTTAQNIAFGLTGWTREAQARRVQELGALLSLDGLEDRLPHQLSGGQQQRVALARALARPVDVLLLDEPFSALDEALRADLRTELLRLRAEVDIPIIFVTHDLREAHLLADSIAVLDGGRVLQHGPREEIFRHPASRRVAELTGVRNLFAGIADGDRVLVEGLPLRVEPVPATAGPVDIAIRAERCLLRRFDPDGPLPENCFVADVTADLAFGNSHTLRLHPMGAGPAVEVETAARPYEVLGIAGRQRWVVELPAADLIVMPRS